MKLLTLPRNAFIVYHMIHGLDNVFIGSFNEISRETGLSRRSCIYAVRSLEKAGLVVTVKVPTGRGIYTNGYIAFPLAEPLSYSSPSPAQIERLHRGLVRLASHSQGSLVLPADVMSLLERYPCTGANFAPGVQSLNVKESEPFKCKEECINVNVNSPPGAESPDKGSKDRAEGIRIRRGIWVRFMDRPSVARPGETVLDLSPVFGVKKYMAVRNATVNRVREAVEAVVAYGRKYVIRNLEAILVAAVTRGWKVARRVVDWAKARLAQKIYTANDDKYRDLYRLVSKEEAERNRASCRAPDAEPVDKYRDLYHLAPAEC